MLGKKGICLEFKQRVLIIEHIEICGYEKRGSKKSPTYY